MRGWEGGASTLPITMAWRSEARFKSSLALRDPVQATVFGSFSAIP